MLVFFYFLIIKRDPSELPSVLINQKAPTFKTTTLFDNKPFKFEEELEKHRDKITPGEVGES